MAKKKTTIEEVETLPIEKKIMSSNSLQVEEIVNTEDLKNFLLNIKDKISEDSNNSIYALTALNYALNLPTINIILNSETKELARDIWLNLKAGGVQLKNPPLLFQEEELVK